VEVENRAFCGWPACQRLTYLQQARQRSKADGETRALQEHMVTQELKIAALTSDLNAFAEKSLSQRTRRSGGRREDSLR
jgi:hypothetical protein